jgi:hypothetical protein
MKLSANFQPNLMIHGDMNIVIIVIASTIGSRKELVTPYIRTTYRNNKCYPPPEEDKPIGLGRVVILSPISSPINLLYSFSDTTWYDSTGRMS